MYDQTASIESFLAATAAKPPGPAGGSAASLAGAMAAALGQMVMAISAGKQDLTRFDAQQRAALDEYTRSQQVFARLMMEDQAAFAAFMAARRLPEQDSNRLATRQAAVLACIRVPQAMAETGVAVLQTCDRVVEMSHPPLLADLAVCADLAMAAVRTGVNLMRVNLKESSDPEHRAATTAAASHLLEHGLALIQHLYPRIWRREAQG